ncbi:MAG: methylated-DNA--[protein]-cysteine S-methyltransferase [Microthrixaceae bacterium]
MTEDVVIDALGGSSPNTPHMEDLHRALARRADDEGLLDLAYRSIDSPYGTFLVVVGPDGLVRVAFELEGHDAVLDEMAYHISPRILRDERRTDAVARQFDEYFSGERHDFELPVDLRLVSGFRRNVLDHMRRVPYGMTTSYAALAEASGSPKAVRAVGSACATNPIPIVVPCHRVVRSDGTTGQYRGGPETKVALLAMEAGSPQVGNGGR